MPTRFYFRSDSAMSRRKQRGQSVIEYLIIVALMAVATMGIFRILSQNVSSKFASITHALNGKSKAEKIERIEDSHVKKKQMQDFFDGAGKTK